jgi:hypothetical protein
MQEYEPMCGEIIGRAAERMVALAKESDDIVVAKFNDIPICAKPGDSPESIVAYYQNESQCRRLKYINSPEYKKQQQEAREAQERHDAALKDALAASSEKMTLSDKAGWEKAVAANTDDYGSGVIRYAERWARLMEGKISRGGTLEACADETSHLADNEGITGIMYGCAVSILSKVWIHGDQLRRWHNLKHQIKDEGEKANASGAVLNPAVITIGGR